MQTVGKALRALPTLSRHSAAAPNCSKAILSARPWVVLQPVARAHLQVASCLSSRSASSSGKGSLDDEEALRNQVAQGSVLGTKAEEAYAIAFTCGVCNTRLAKRISKLAYHKGVVIVTCDSCKNRHLIADNLKWFGEETSNIETIMREKGEEVIRLSQYRMAGDSSAIPGPLVQVEGLDPEAWSGSSAPSAQQSESHGPPPVPVPELQDSESIAAAAEAAGKEVAAAKANRLESK